MLDYYKIRMPDPQGVFIVDDAGDMQWLSVPFSAACITSTGPLKAYSLVYVDGVGYTDNGDLVFFIDNRPYHQCHFVLNTSY